MRKLVVLLVASMSLAALAQQEKKPAQPPTKEIIFDGDVIEGASDQPDVEYFRHGSPAYRRSLIKIRTEFKDKVMESARDL